MLVRTMIYYEIRELDNSVRTPLRLDFADV